jgi:cobalamin biosynthesis protein CobT
MPSFDAMPVELARVVEKAVRNVRRAKSTQDVLAIARWVKAELQGQQITLPPMQTQPGQGEAGEGDGQGEAGEAGTGQGEAGEAGTGQGEAGEAGTAGTGQGEAGTGQGEASEAPASGTPTAGTEAGKDTGQGSAKGERGGQGGERGGKGAWDVTDAAQRDPEADLSDLGDRVSERNGRKAGEVAIENSRVTEFLNVGECTVRGRNRQSPDSRITDHVAAKIPSPAKLRRDVTKAVRSPERTSVARHETKGRYDNRASARALAGAVNVFRRREEEEGREAAVSFLIDLSSSMSGKPIETAVALALHLGDALRAASVPFEVMGFTMPGHLSTPKAGLTVAKAFGDPWQDARPYVGALVNAPSGGTSMMPAIVGASKRLRAKTGVTRRILLCLVEVVMIGCLEDVSAYGPRHVNVMNLRDVTTDGLGALVDVLEGRKPRHRHGLAPVA